MMDNSKSAVILVGHGGLPSDMPSEIVEKFMRVHKTRIKSGGEISELEEELDNKIRQWERTPETDPYKSGLELLVSHMKPFLENYTVITAYNEFCHPTIEVAIEELAKENFSKIILVTTMITRGGSHSEREIPEELEALRVKYPNVEITYAWPFDMDAFALFLANHVKTTNPLMSAPTN
jgi:sirohydrochlorin cobaltochelatase